MTRSMQNTVEPMLLAYLADKPKGAQAREMVRDLKLTIQTVRKYLCLMHKQDIVLWVGTPGYGTWTTQENKPQAIKHLACLKETVRRERVIRERARKKKVRKKMTPEVMKVRLEKMKAEIDRWAEEPSKRRWIPASEAAPIKKAGPASVWELAA